MFAPSSDIMYRKNHVTYVEPMVSFHLMYILFRATVVSTTEHYLVTYNVRGSNKPGKEFPVQIISAASRQLSLNCSISYNPPTPTLGKKMLYNVS